ncbi:MAG: TolC family protein [Oligoflexus sp.]|nr:TolC family protein [Oligoflexus sp.]
MKAWVFVLLALFSRTGLSADALTLSYDELGDLIQKNNKSVQGSIEAIAAARQRVGTLEQTFLPKFGVEAGIAEQREANGVGDTAPFWKIDVSANIYRGGRDDLGILVRESQVLIREMDNQAQFRAELFKAKLDYVRLNSVRQAINLTQSSTDDYDGIRKSILVKAGAGLMTTTSAQAIQLELDELRRQLIILKREEVELEERLALVLGLEQEQKLTLTTAQINTNSSWIPVVTEEDIQGLPEVKKYSLLARSSSLEAKVRNEWWRPDVSIFAAVTGFNVDDKNEFRSLPEREMNFGVRLSVDLETKRTFGSELIAKQSDVASLASQGEYLRRDVEHKVHEYRREMEVQADLSRTFEQGVARAEKLLKQMRGEFERGIGSNSDITGIIRTLYQLKRNRIESVMDYHLSLAGLETMSDASFAEK